ncbi:MAG: polymerase, sigma-24 subunit, subfamily [Lacunisphaera sp.]|nr:polymerase, sigma-24 subunit, subfamily [Lacunisphaera sp.]MDB6164994.1 polymerase, sigma-24 subunit, subfamily [Lacunisphaera sp.]
MPDPAKPPGDFEALYRATLAPLRRYLARLLGSSTEAQDVAHDAYSKVYKTMADKPVSQPQGLLFTTARNLAINQLRRRDRSPVQSASADIIELAPTQAPGVVREVMARQEWAATEAAIARLPLGCRAVFLLCRFEGLTHPEAAARLGISRKTVEKQHARALRLLRASLQTDEAAPGQASDRPNLSVNS